jgi:putative MATE family efflux protein
MLVLALPMLASSLLGGVVFQLADLVFLSWLGGSAMASVIIVNQTLRQLVMMLAMGFSFGTQALVARAIGEGRSDRAEHVAGQVVLLGALFSALVAAAGWLAPDLLFSLSGPDPSFYATGVPYLRLVCLLSFGLVGAQGFSAILGGAGDTTTPLLVMLVQTAVAIGAEWVLAFGHLGAPALGVRGIALGVACGQVVSMAIGLAVLFSGRSRVHLRLRHLAPDPSTIASVLRLSWPPALQLGVSVLTTLVYLRLAGRFGESVQTAYAVGLRLGMIVPMVCFPLAGACATLVGQALGAGDRARAWRAIRVGVLAHGSLMACFALLVLLLRWPIMDLFSDDPEVIAVGAEYLLFAAGAFFAWAFYFPFMRALQGAGDMFAPMAISTAGSLLVSIPLAAWLALGTPLGRVGLWAATLVTSVVVTLATGLRVASGRWAARAAHSPAGTGPT